MDRPDKAIEDVRFFLNLIDDDGNIKASMAAFAFIAKGGPLRMVKPAKTTLRWIEQLEARTSESFPDRPSEDLDLLTGAFSHVTNNGKLLSDTSFATIVDQAGSMRRLVSAVREALSWLEELEAKTG